MVGKAKSYWFLPEEVASKTLTRENISDIIEVVYCELPVLARLLIGYERYKKLVTKAINEVVEDAAISELIMREESEQ